MSESTRNLLVLKVATTPEVTLESVSGHLSAHIKGRMAAFDDATFKKLAHIERIKTVYKIASGNASAKSRKPVNGTNGTPGGREINETKTLEVQILGLIALRGAT